MPILFIIGSMVALFVYSRNIDETPMQKPKSSIPTIYDQLFVSAGKTYGVDWKMLKAISWVESRTGTFKSVARGIASPTDVKGSVSQDGLSWGIMQMTLTTAKGYDKMATEVKLNDPAFSINLGAKHIAFLKKAYPTFSERDIVMSYNHGQGNQLNFIKKEKAGILLVTEYPAGRDYWKKYQAAKELL